MTEQPVRVMLVDDQAMVRAGFRMIIESEPDLTVVCEAADGREAFDALDACRPDVVLMDVRMPRMDGLEATALITARPDAPRVLMVTTFDAEDYVYAALRAGASGFLLKDAPAEQLIEAIRVVHRGDALLAPSVTRMLIADIAKRPPAEPCVAVPGIDELTDRELEVMRLLARGMSNAEIADSLYLGEATVKTHVGRVLAKLDLRDRVQAVVAAYESGLVTPGSHPPD
jgi:DNA-binding NarL/FixJ family response regulator